MGREVQPPDRVGVQLSGLTPEEGIPHKYAVPSAEGVTLYVGPNNALFLKHSDGTHEPLSAEQAIPYLIQAIVLVGNLALRR